MNNEVILSVKDLDIQFNLRGRELKAIVNVLWICTEVRLWPLLENRVRENRCLLSLSWECWMPRKRYRREY